MTDQSRLRPTTKLPDLDSLLSLSNLLLLAGNLTTTDLIGNGTKALLENPEQLAKLRAPHYRKQHTTMKYCFKRKGCAAFAECMLSIW